MNIPFSKKTKKTKKQRIAAYRENIPDKYHGAYRKTYDRAMSGKSLRAAINAKCNDCMCWEGVGVRKCDIVECPLHPYRPGSKKRQTDPVSSNPTPQSALGAVVSEQTAAGAVI